MTITRNARPALERLGLMATRRGPCQRLAPKTLRVHMYPVASPLPHPGYVDTLEGDPPPDRGRTRSWHQDVEG
jgi:hypothetical protein